MTCNITDNQLGILFSYDTGKYSDELMDRLISNYRSSISELIAVAEQAENVVATVMDITVSEQSQKDVTLVNDMITGVADDAQQEQDLDALFEDF